MILLFDHSKIFTIFKNDYLHYSFLSLSYFIHPYYLFLFPYSALHRQLDHHPLLLPLLVIVLPLLMPLLVVVIPPLLLPLLVIVLPLLPLYHLSHTHSFSLLVMTNIQMAETKATSIVNDQHLTLLIEQLN